MAAVRREGPRVASPDVRKWFALRTRNAVGADNARKDDHLNRASHWFGQADRHFGRPCLINRRFDRDRITVNNARPLTRSRLDLVKTHRISDSDLERFVRFAASKDAKLRKEYTMEVLKYATILTADGGKLPLTTDALINNHLGSWENVRDVFEEVLRQNGIKPAEHCRRANYWVDAGSAMATSFVAEVSIKINEFVKR